MKDFTVNPPDTVASQFEHIVMEKIAFGLQGRVSASFMRDIQVKAEGIASNAGEDITYRIRGMVLSRDVATETLPDIVDTTQGKRTEVAWHEIPSTWWDHAKHELITRRRRWLKFTNRDGTTITIAFRWFPWIRVAFPKYYNLVTEVQQVVTTTIKRTTITRHCRPHLEVGADHRHIQFMTTLQATSDMDEREERAMREMWDNHRRFPRVPCKPNVDGSWDVQALTATEALGLIYGGEYFWESASNRLVPTPDEEVSNE